MGLFNVVLLDDGTCSACRRHVQLRVQFKFGDLALRVDRIGDHLRWGGQDEGERGLKSVVVLGDAEPCPRCGTHTGSEFEVWLEDDRLTAVKPNGGTFPFFEDSNDGYVVLER